MNKTLGVVCMLALMNQAFAENRNEISPVEKDAVVKELLKEADSGKHPHKIKIMLKKVASEVGKLDDCENCVGKPKEKVIATNIGRKVGKGSAWLTTVTAKPFMNAAGFLRGFFEKSDKNKDVVGLYAFLLNHSDEFDKIYIEAGTSDEMVELVLGKTDEIIKRKARIILGDFLKTLGITREIPEDLSDFELSDEEIASIDMDKVSPDLINNHPEYKELKPIIGDMSEEDVNDIIISGYFDTSIPMNNYKAALPSIHEGIFTIVGQIVGPKIALGAISNSLAGIYATPVLAADIGTGISTAICMQKETQAKFETDKDLRSFCSYVINRSGYELIKSRAKGYLAGKRAKEKLEAKKKK